MFMRIFIGLFSIWQQRTSPQAVSRVVVTRSVESGTMLDRSKNGSAHFSSKCSLRIPHFVIDSAVFLFLSESGKPA